MNKSCINQHEYVIASGALVDGEQTPHGINYTIRYIQVYMIYLIYKKWIVVFKISLKNMTSKDTEMTPREYYHECKPEELIYRAVIHGYDTDSLDHIIKNNREFINQLFG